MKSLCLEFVPSLADRLIDLSREKPYEKYVVFVERQHELQCKIFIEELKSTKVHAFVYDKYVTKLDAAYDYLTTCLYNSDINLNFFVVVQNYTFLEKVGIEFAKKSKIKTCFLCIDDDKRSFFNIDDAEFIRVCIDNFDSVSDTEFAVSSNKVDEMKLIGKFDFLNKFKRK